MNKKIQLFLTPLIASVICNIVVLAFFVSHYGSLNNFFLTNKNSDTNLLIFVAMLLLAVVFGIVTSVICIFFIWSNDAKKEPRKDS